MKRPQEITDSQVAKEVARLLDGCGLLQKDVAKMCGFPSYNLLSMIKRGNARMPLDRIDAFAEATGGSSLLLKELVLREYFSEVMEMAEEVFSGRELSEDEAILAEIFREERQAYDKQLREEALEVAITDTDRRQARRVFSRLKLTPEADVRLRKALRSALSK